MSSEAINRGRNRDRALKDRYFNPHAEIESETTGSIVMPDTGEGPKKRRFWSWLMGR